MAKKWYLPIMAPGLPFILTGLGVTLLCGILSLCTPWAGTFFGCAIACALTTGLLAWFFRDPERNPEEAAMSRLKAKGQLPVLAPADGRITDIVEMGTHKRIGVFLSIFDCHVQRSPVSGHVSGVQRKAGKKLPAFHPHSSAKSAAAIISLEHPTLGKVVVRQIVGAIARRIITQVKIGDSLQLGQRLGMILM